MTSQPYIIVASGGTGGHMFPALSLVDILERRGFRVSLLSDRRGQQYLSEDSSITVHFLASGSPNRGGPLGMFASLIGIIRGTIAARALFKNDRPDVVVGFGGYSALPAMLAASSMGVPIAIHEQNAVLGRVNRLMAGRAGLIALSFENTSQIKDLSKVRVVGNPVRSSIIALRDLDYTLPDPNGPIRLLVMGGSQGASVFSTLVPDAISLLPKSLKSHMSISQHCREGDVDKVKERYLKDGIEADVFAFGPDISVKLGLTHLVISRAGASTIAELGVCGRPAILIPLPSALDDHQTANANLLVDVGGGWLMPEAELDAPALTNHLVDLFEQPDQMGLAALMARKTGRPEAGSLLADMIEELISGTPASDALDAGESPHSGDRPNPERRVAA